MKKYLQTFYKSKQKVSKDKQQLDTQSPNKIIQPPPQTNNTNIYFKVNQKGNEHRDSKQKQQQVQQQVNLSSFIIDEYFTIKSNKYNKQNSISSTRSPTELLTFTPSTSIKKSGVFDNITDNTTPEEYDFDQQNNIFPYQIDDTREIKIPKINLKSRNKSHDYLSYSDVMFSKIQPNKHFRTQLLKKIEIRMEFFIKKIIKLYKQSIKFKNSSELNRRYVVYDGYQTEEMVWKKNYFQRNNDDTKNNKNNDERTIYKFISFEQLMMELFICENQQRFENLCKIVVCTYSKYSDLNSIITESLRKYFSKDFSNNPESQKNIIIFLYNLLTLREPDFGNFSDVLYFLRGFGWFTLIKTNMHQKSLVNLLCDLNIKTESIINTEIKNFIRNGNSRKNPLESNNSLQQNIFQNFETQKKLLLTKTFQSVENFEIVSQLDYFLSFSATEIAQQLCLIDYEKYRNINISHLYTYLAENKLKNKKFKSQQSVVKSIIQSHKMLTYYLISLVLRQKNKIDRAELIQRYLQISKELKEYRNFNSLGIFSTKLDSTWSLIPQYYISIKDDITIFLNPSGRFNLLRQVIKQSQEVYLPCIFILCCDATIINELDTFKQVDDQILINFEKMELLTNVFSVILDFKKDFYQFSSNDKLYLFLQSHFKILLQSMMDYNNQMAVDDKLNFLYEQNCS